jgi:hypothetical protein
MHRIIDSHLKEFVSNMGFDNLDKPAQFERFANYCIALGFCPTTIESDEITTGSDDSGIDGLAVIIDEEIVLSEEFANEVFGDNKRNHEVMFLAVQAKTSEKFELGDVLKFTSAVERLYLNDNYEPNEPLEKSVNSIFSISIDKANKIRGGRPSIYCAYVTTGVYNNPKEIQRAFDDSKLKFVNSGIFENVEFQFIGRDDLIKIWSDSRNGVEAKLELHNVAAMLKIEHITESYLAVVNAKELVSNLLQDKDGRLRAFVFEENVRSFLGSENPVNAEIRKTILDSDKCMMFPVLNNGITIVSPDVVMQGTIANLNGFQIVNGCQTSNILFREKEALPDEMMVNVKIIETSNIEVLSELVRATNSQSKIDDSQFFH